MNTLFDLKKKPVKPTKPKQITDSFEIFKETPNKIVHEAKNTVTDAAGDFWKQLLGVDNKKGEAPKGGELKPGQALNLKDIQKNQENKPNIMAAMDHSGEIMRSSETAIQQENAELKQTIQQLVAELKQLEKSNPVVSAQIEQATAGNIIKVGKYHRSFFSHVLSIISEARQRASSGELWKNTINKKGQGPNIHKLMKTNMQVGMSSERSVATSVG